MASRFTTIKREVLELEHGESTRRLECGSQDGKGIAVLTSGGDAQGMNAAVRAVVRTGLYLGCKVYFIMEGYQGLVDDDIEVATWVAVSAILQKGGTVIGSARCQDFRSRDGRLKAAKNLVKRGISHLVVIGGDGSLTGANTFRSEWSSLLEELLENKEIESAKGVEHLNIVGIVGSIDNDFCGTDMTIGADTALHRILEATDAITCTAYSHQRTFIMEIMGRHCGYLALCAGLLANASAVYIPEEPAKNWEVDLLETIRTEREEGQRLSIIVVAEGALKDDGTPLTCEMVKEVVQNELKQDVRITVLGHVQRGGSPSAFDRLLGSRMGVEALLTLLDSKPGMEAQVITLIGRQAIRLPLMQCVKKTQAVAKAMAEKKWELAVELRGKAFNRRLATYKRIHSAQRMEELSFIQGERNFAVAIVHVGSPACGMNAAVESIVKTGAQHKIDVYGVADGLNGLIHGNMQKMTWSEVAGWVGEGGALLGTKRGLPYEKFSEIAKVLRSHNIDGLIIIGGFEAFHTAMALEEQRSNHPELRIPILVMPASISNNVPGCDLSLGSDTALNEIVEICDRMRQSAQGTKRRVFICETMGGYCGYLATMAGLAGGADATYIYEEEFNIRDLQRDLYNIASKMCAGVQRGLVLRNEKCNENYTCDFMQKLYAEEGKGIFSARKNIIGHMQQGRTSSPFDRNMGLTLGIRGIQWFKYIFADCIPGAPKLLNKESVAVLGLVKDTYAFTPVSDLIDEVDFPKRVPKHQWWMKLRAISRIIARHESTYEKGTVIYYDDPATFGNFTDYENK